MTTRQQHDVEQLRAVHVRTEQAQEGLNGDEDGRCAIGRIREGREERLRRDLVEKAEVFERGSQVCAGIVAHQDHVLAHPVEAAQHVQRDDQRQTGTGPDLRRSTARLSNKRVRLRVLYRNREIGQRRSLQAPPVARSVVGLNLPCYRVRLVCTRRSLTFRSRQHVNYEPQLTIWSWANPNSMGTSMGSGR